MEKNKSIPNNLNNCMIKYKVQHPELRKFIKILVGKSKNTKTNKNLQQKSTTKIPQQTNNSLFYMSVASCYLDSFVLL